MSEESPKIDPTRGVVRIGRGPHHVLCLHGWFGSADGWGPFVEHLDEERFTYAFVNYRGYGARKDEPGSYSLGEIAQDALKVADALGFERFSLIGHSMGGAAVAKVFSLAPERVRSLVALTPVAASGFPLDADSYNWFASAADDLPTRRAILDKTTGNRLTGVWLDRMTAHSAEKINAQAFGAYFDAWATARFQEQLVGKSCPALVIVGGHDPAMTEDYVASSWRVQFPELRLERMENAGHYPMFETPLALATRVEAFLAEF